MIFVETPRLHLRALRKAELSRLVEQIDVWEIVKWLVVVPFPYTLKDAEDFFELMAPSVAEGRPEFYTLALKSDDLLIGGAGLHPPRGQNAVEGEIELGYWLGRKFWGRGLMTEAVQTLLNEAFKRPDITMVSATTSINNVASQNVLLKAGLRNAGIVPTDYEVLRGAENVIRWELTREAWNERTLFLKNTA